MKNRYGSSKNKTFLWIITARMIRDVWILTNSKLIQTNQFQFRILIQANFFQST